MFSIVTVVKGDLIGLAKTCKSIDQYVIGGRFEHIVWWNADHTLIKRGIPELEYRNIIEAHDVGIFDAMNRALKKCKGKYVLFLNANDTFEDFLDIGEFSRCTGPYLIKVKYINYFGYEKLVRVRSTIKMGIPYCHQGMVLERDKLSFPINQKFGGDYVALLNCDYTWPIRVLHSGLIRYDTRGVSSINRWRS